MPSAARQHILQAHANDNSLRRANGQRVAAFSGEFVQALHVSLLEQFAENTQDVLYRSGYEWGLRDLVALQRELSTSAGGAKDLWQLELPEVLATWWSQLAEAGWGDCHFDVSPGPITLVVAKLQGSAVAAAVGASDQPVCHLYAGLMAGALSFYHREELHATEVQCQSLGAASCLFVVTAGPLVDSAEAWRQQGVPAAEIVRRLQQEVRPRAAT